MDRVEVKVIETVIDRGVFFGGGPASRDRHNSATDVNPPPPPALEKKKVPMLIPSFFFLSLQCSSRF